MPKMAQWAERAGLPQMIEEVAARAAADGHDLSRVKRWTTYGYRGRCIFCLAIFDIVYDRDTQQWEVHYAGNRCDWER